MPDLARNGLNSRDHSRSGASDSDAFQLHARLEIMDGEILTVHLDGHVVGNIGEVPELSVFHLDDQVIAFHCDHFASIHFHHLRC